MKSMTTMALSLVLATAAPAVYGQSAEQAPADETQEWATRSAAPQDATATQAEPAARPLKGQIGLQGENTLLADDLLGATVLSPSAKTLGKVNNLIVGLDGSVEGVVIGVGGLLGIGEKDVAVALNALDLRPVQDGEVQLVLNASKADLEAAPAFKSVAEQRAEQAVEEARNRQLQNLQDSGVPSAESVGTAAQ